MNNSIIPVLLACSVAASPAPPAQPAGKGSEADKIGKYLQGLKYDPRALLAIKEPGSTESMPVKSEGKNGVIICTSIPRKIDKDLEEITILSPSANSIFPGALVRANRNLAEGKPDLITLPRAPITLSVDLPMSKSHLEVQNPALSSVKTALQKINEEWFKDSKNVQAARTSFVVKKAYNSTQIALDLGVSVKWGGGNAFKMDSSTSMASSRSICIALFKQIYYTASIDPPAQPADVFDKTVTLDQVQRVVNTQNPAIAYVKSMDYGRIIMVRMDTSSSEDKADLEAAMQYATAGPAGTTVKADLKAKYEQIINNSTFTVLTLGGNAATATQVMENPKAAKENLYKLINGSAKFDRQNPGFPIAYTVDFLNDNSLAKFGFSSDYIETSCKEYPNGYVKLVNDGHFVARYWITWVETGKDGKTQVKKEWNSGKETKGFKYTQMLPGDAKKIVVYGEADSGVGWRELIREELPGPPNKCYRLYGWATGPKVDNDCQ